MVQQLRIEDALIGAVFVVCCGFHDYRDGMHNLHCGDMEEIHTSFSFFLMGGNQWEEIEYKRELETEEGREKKTKQMRRLLSEWDTRYLKAVVAILC